MKKILLLTYLAMILVFTVACSSAGNNVIPGVDASDQTLKGTDNQGLSTTRFMGLWHVAIEKDTGEINAVRMRQCDLILNILCFLEPPAMSGMTIDFGSLIISNPTVEVEIIIKHPMPGSEFKGFDVRGVVFGPKVTNADGLTIIPSPQYFKNVPFGYIDGLLGVPDGYANYEGLAGYKYFCDGLFDDDDLVEFFSDADNLDRRGVFSEAPNARRRDYVLNWSDVSHSFFTFNYAIYANYDWPMGTPPYTVSDFPVFTANCAEAFCAQTLVTQNTLYYSGGGGGGTISLEVEVWDWLGDVADVRIKSMDPGVIDETSYDYEANGNTVKSRIYGFTALPGNPTKTGANCDSGPGGPGCRDGVCFTKAHSAQPLIYRVFSVAGNCWECISRTCERVSSLRARSMGRPVEAEACTR